MGGDNDKEEEEVVLWVWMSLWEGWKKSQSHSRGTRAPSGCLLAVKLVKGGKDKGVN